MPKIRKATELTNANITFVSLVDKAANGKQFAIIKSENGSNFGTYAPIVKVDEEQRIVTAVVYEPMVEDSQGDYMTEECIEKAAHQFMINKGENDIQHNFQAAEGVSVVESWVTKSDETIGDQEIKKGTWMMSSKVDNDDIWDDIKKGELTGYSMGGIAQRSEEDVDLDEVEKSMSQKIITAIQKAFGIAPVAKGEMEDEYKRRIKGSNFWTAFYTLADLLEKWDSWDWEAKWETDEEKIKAALEDFNKIVTDLLLADEVLKSIGKPPEEVQKAYVEKAGKTISAINMKAIQTAYETLGGLIEANTEEEGEETMKAEDITKAVEAALEPVTKRLDALEKANEPGTEGDPAGEVEKTDAEIITEAVEKAVAPLTERIEKMEQSRNVSKQQTPPEGTPGQVTTKSYIQTIQKAAQQ